MMAVAGVLGLFGSLVLLGISVYVKGNGPAALQKPLQWTGTLMILTAFWMVGKIITYWP